MSFLINNINVTNDLIEGTLRIQSRCDTAIAQGNCSLYTNKITKNIAPYTLCEIDGDYFFISSTATEDMQNSGYWTHDCDILELTAILQCYIVGTKYFSGNANHTDFKKIDLLRDFICDKYGISITLNLSGINQNHEFSFGAGTTLLQAISEIMTWYNKRPKVTSVTFSGGTYQITISNLDISSNTTYSLDDSKLISKVYYQNVDDYGAILESEMQNVVDRNEVILFKDLTCRSDNIKFDTDNAILALPVNVEEIKELTCNRTSTFNYIASIVFDGLDPTDWNSISYTTISATTTNGITSPEKKVSDAKTWETWRGILIDTWTEDGDSQEINICDKIFEYFLAPKGFTYDDIKSTTWIFWYTTNDLKCRLTPSVNIDYSNGKGIFYAAQAVTDLPLNILESKAWSVLEAREKAKYAVYESGTNIISNLYNKYNSNIFTDWLGVSVGPVIKESLSNYDFETTVDYVTHYNATATCKISIGASGNDNPIEFRFNVKCIPVANPLLLDKDTSAKVNESATKNISKNYQKSASTISFDSVIESIQKTNKMLGQPELSIEYDTTGIPGPNITDKITIDNADYYVLSLETTYFANYKTTLVNLCNSYSKIADAIGVESQYESTRLPLTGVVERPIFFTANVSSGANIPATGLLKFVFYYEDGTTARTLFKRPIKMEYGNRIMFYCEMKDNYSFDTKIVDTSGAELTSISGSSVNQCWDVPYGDSNNEAYAVQITHYPNIELDMLQSYKLPDFTGTLGSYDFQVGNKIIKDAREKLTFTILLNKV